MTVSNDNRRARKKRGRGPESIAKMARVLADIYAGPPTTIISQDALSARVEEEGAPAIREVEPVVLPANGDR